VFTDLKKARIFVRVYKMTASETLFAAFGSVQKQALRTLTEFSFQISLVKFCSCGLGESDSHGRSDTKMVERTATEIATAKWRNEQPRK
jgi:hypothetical protein